MTPIDALDVALMYVGCVDPRKPGAVIQRCSREIREALRRLTSDEALQMRPDIWVRRQEMQVRAR